MSSEGAAAIAKDRKRDKHELKPNRCDHEEGTRQSIPLDIVASVLLMLPAKSIGRFRCVCRRWRSLTHDARFIDEHRRLGGASGSHSLLDSDPIRVKTMVERLSIYEVGPNCDEIKHGVAHIKFDDEPADDFYAFTNSVNGLISVMGTVLTLDIFMLNPITREISQLPRHCNMARPCLPDTFGLGFDASTGAYKLVLFRDTFSCSSFKVLTVGTGAWRRIGATPLVVRSRPVFLHGTLHWLVNTLDHHSEPTGLSVLAFDVEHETLRFIPAPEISTSDLNSKTRLPLLNLEGHLCIGEVSTFVSARIWMLTGYTNHEWKPLYQIDMSILAIQSRANLFRDFKVIDIRYGQVLMQSQDAIYSYDLHGQNWRRVCCGDFLHALDVITESLVSPRDLIGTLYDH